MDTMSFNTKTKNISLLLLLALVVIGPACDDRPGSGTDASADAADDAASDADGTADANGDAGADTDGGCEQIGVLVRDEMDGDLESYAARGGRWSIVDGWATLEDPAVDDAHGNLLIHSAAVYSDAVIRTRTIVPSETDWDDVAVVFGYVDESSYFIVSFNEMNDGDTSGVFRVQGDEVVELVDITAPLIPGEPAEIEVDLEGHRFTVRLDGETVATGEDEQLRGGRIGLSTYNNSARFDFLEVELGACDAEAPSTPGALSGTSSSARVDLTWAEARDDTAVVGYSVMRDGEALTAQLVTTLRFSDSNVTAGETYTYAVVAHDAAGRSSAESTVEVSVSGGNPGAIVLSVDFDSTPLGAYAGSALDADWPGLVWQSAERCVIVEGEDAYSGRSLRVFYPRGSVGPLEGGAQWRVELPELYDELFLSYRVRFEPGFEFVRGGKLPGLFGGAGNTGGGIPTGTDGWSGRMMWRAAGLAVQYLYYPDQPRIWGEDIPWDEGFERHFVPGEWSTVEHRFVINTPGEADGLLQGWWNGVLAVERPGLRLRDVDTFAVDGFYFSTFFGGNTADFAAARDEYIYFDDFVISTESITH